MVVDLTNSKPKVPVSVIVLTHNEEKNIARALNSAQWADEIIVVDSFSTDNTLTIAKPLATKIIERKFTNHAEQKNAIIPLAKHSWVAVLDADESFTPELANEIEHTIKQPMHYHAYWITRLNHYLNKPINWGDWRNDRVIRLFKRDSCKYSEVNVHEEVVTQHPIGKLKQKLNHYTYRGWNNQLEKLNQYSSWSAADKLARTPKITAYHLLFRPGYKFFRCYILRLGFLDGLPGLIIAYLAAWTVFQRFVKIYLLQKHNEKTF